MKFSFALAILAVSSAHGSKVTIPYAGGKLAQSVTVQLNGISPDSILVGDRFLIRALVDYSGLLSCSVTHPLGLQAVDADWVARRPDHDTNWMAWATFPQSVSSMILLDSIKQVGIANSKVYGPARGYWFARIWSEDCMWDRFALDSAYQQVVFVRKDSVYLKFRLVNAIHRVPTTPPEPPYGDRTLLSITLRLVVSDDPGDLVDPNPPVSLRSPSKRLQRGSVGTAKGFYNPLGIQLGPEPAPFSPALPRR